MPITAVDGSSSTVSYGGTSLGAVTGIEWSGMERAMIESTNLTTENARTYIAASLYDAGSVTLEVDIMDNTILVLLTSLVADPESAAGTLVIASTAGTYTCDALVQSCDPLSVTSGEKVTASVTFKLSGAVT